MGFLDNLFKDDKKKSGGGQNNNNNNSNSNNNNNNNKKKNNPLANIRKNIEQLVPNQQQRMAGPGYSLGGSKPGEVLRVELPNPGSIGVRVEKRSNNSASAIVNGIVPGSQAEASGLQRGDVLCFAGSNGQNEIPYDMFLQIARSPERPIHLEARRFDGKTPAVASGAGGGGSADAEARRRAMIAAAEARNKKHKSQTKTVKYVTKSTLLKQQQQQQQQLEFSAEPQSEASRRAAEEARRGEARTAAELGYNPYESIKKTAGQARSATATTQHGAISAPGGVTAPVAAPPRNPTSAADDEIVEDDPRFPHHEFEMALATILSTDHREAAVSGLKISRKLIANATTKGQKPGEASEKFRRVRLANPKIQATIVDVPGNLPLMLSVGFELHPDDANPDESLLVFPPGFGGPKWLRAALKSMEDAETNGLA